MNTLIVILTGLFFAWISGLLLKGNDIGGLGDSVVGVLGAFVGAVLFDLFTKDAMNVVQVLLTASFGSVFFLVIVTYLMGPKSERSSRFLGL